MVRNGPTLASDLGLLSFQTFLEAVAVAVELQYMAPVSKAVQDSAGETFVCEHLHPPAEFEIGSHQETALQVALSTHLKEESGFV